MRLTRTHVVAGLLIAALGLSACTNTRQDVTILSATKALWAMRRGEAPKLPDDRVVAFEVKRALESTDGPLTLVQIDKNKAVAVLRPIEQNGAYTTWTTWGRTERRSVTTKQGVITATRGLGEDLMSSSVDRLLRMVKGREDGIDRQVLRHLDGENIIVETAADCAFTPDGTEEYALGYVRQTAVRIDVFCKTETGSFRNYYLVSPSGRILKSHQWLGPGLGHGTLQVLR